ncbi:hypothetical protein LCGC14_1993070, partial [marine sediment metagenome]
MVGITRARFMEELVLWMPMTEGAGTLVKDQSKYHNNGAFGPAGAAPSWVVGRGEDAFVDPMTAMVYPNTPSFRLRYYSFLLSRHIRSPKSFRISYVYGDDIDIAETGGAATN